MQNLTVSSFVNLPSSKRFEQFLYLLFLKRLDNRENAAERQAKRKGDEVSVVGGALGVLDADGGGGGGWDEDHPRIFHECSNGILADSSIRGFIRGWLSLSRSSRCMSGYSPFEARSPRGKWIGCLSLLSESFGL